MKATVLAAVTALAIVPALTSAADAASTRAGTWTFTDYTPDPASVAADDALHVVNGATIASYCHGSRVPASPQDVTAHVVKLATPSVLQLRVNATGVWGLDVTTQRGTPFAGMAATPGANSSLAVKLRPGRYVVRACNLGGAPTAQVSYRLR